MQTVRQIRFCRGRIQLIEVMLKHIVWDWNGTLLDDVELCVDILNKALLEHGKERITVSEYRRTFFFPVADFYETLGLPSDGPTYDRLAENYIIEYRKRYKECKLHEGAAQVVRKLQSLKISQSILSAGKLSDLTDFTAHYGIDKLMKKIDGASDIRATGKADRALSHVSSFELKRDQVLFIGDTCHDSEVARKVQCRVLLFEGGHKDLESLMHASAPVIKSLIDVLGWVRN